jgi:uncharacterized protein (TIGR02145 family)
MDRNLGASQAATSSTDAAAYGDLYQWGRRADGHQCRTSATTATLSSIDQPTNGNFITVFGDSQIDPLDWRTPQNDNLWQGVNGVNNPCPSGYRIPTETELNAERLSWSSNNGAGAFASPLKLTYAGYRNTGGGIVLAGIWGYYWSSSFETNFFSGFKESNFLQMGSSVAFAPSDSRAFGRSVRCIKD